MYGEYAANVQMAKYVPQGWRMFRIKVKVKR
jgi:hypothetical protein